MARTKEFDPDGALEKATELFWLRGYEATSVRDLLHGMGIGRGSLYDTFGDKRALFLAALDRYCETHAARTAEVLRGPGSAKDAVRKVFEAAVDGLSGDELRRGCLLANTAVELAPHDPEVAERVSRSLRRTEEAFRAALIQTQTSGEIPTRHDPRVLARFLLNNLQGMRVLARAGADRTTLEDAARVALEALEK